MRYFFISQDTSLPCCIRYRDFDITGGRHLFVKSEEEKIKEMVPLYLAGSGREARPDFIQRPVTMFSAGLREILKAYEPEAVFKDVMLIHKENAIQYHYVHTLLDYVDALSGRSEYYPNGMERKLVLDGKKAEGHHLFLPAGAQRKDPVVSLPLAESLLRRSVVGICLEEVEVE